MASQALIVAIILTISFILASILSLNSGELASEISQLIGGVVPSQTSQTQQQPQTIDDVIKLLEDELNSATSQVNASQLQDTIAKQTTTTTFASATQPKLPTSTPITTSTESATQISAQSQTNQASTETMTTTQTQQPRVDFSSLSPTQIVAIFVGGLVATIIILTAATRI
ncbi:MAG TPA: hypothetical protein VJJ76_02405 [archaeon]|uniref:Uncharacterized protein n=1 Tax=Candidatus Wolfebacteria bacterium RIFCSPLOWO2_01_FULL_47_17b TaxID=1802558 RepID=A0A1F8DZY4_9BACT|nr:MAG: hypothetical protein A2935_03745 [Candidatus Wolfebacteria bacterium RIFCSPLOWO2_01_FULL_47_17b]HLC39710.1 hypothetical protein [archaeon]